MLVEGMCKIKCVGNLCHRSAIKIQMLGLETFV